MVNQDETPNRSWDIEFLDFKAFLGLFAQKMASFRIKLLEMDIYNVK